jgi:hydroxymethylpyrimidine/phosphomethylpyrimidine kinase
MTKTLLIIAGSDSSGGAGIAADLRAARKAGIQARLAVTAVTAQTPDGVTHVAPVPVEALRAQLDAAGSVDAVKIGMLYDTERVQCVAGWLAERRLPVVLDPVMRSTSGGALLDDEGVDALWKLFDHTSLVTPNQLEAQALAGEGRWDDWAEAVPCPVLVTGGDVEGEEIEDLLFINENIVEYVHARIEGTHRGTGCALATLIASRLARGEVLESAVGEAIQDLEELLRG